MAMNYNTLLKKLKEKYVPELNGIDIQLKKAKQSFLMYSSPFSKYIYYNEKITNKLNKEILRAVLIHELYHKVQYLKLGIFKRLIKILMYKLSNKTKEKIELEAHTETVKRGFGRGIILLRRNVISRHNKEQWAKIKHLFLTDKQVKKIMKKV